MLLGLTDLFVGASAVALLLIVLAKQMEEPARIPQADVSVRCLADRGGIVLSGQRGDDQPWTQEIDDIRNLPDSLDHARLTARVTVRTSPEDLSCFWKVKAVIDSYNRSLGMREGLPGPLVVLGWLAEDADDASAGVSR